MTGRVRVLFAILVVFLVCYMDNKDRTWCKSTSYEITEADGGRSNTYIDLLVVRLSSVCTYTGRT
jgi:hypothetical protein